MSNPNTRKSCVVPKCRNTTTNSLEKLFFIVPKDVKLRKKWIKAMKRLDSFGDKSTVYCCEDHFDVENDMENYIKYKLVGGRLKLKKGVVPHKFICQQQRIDNKNQRKKMLDDGTTTSSNDFIEEIFVPQSPPQDTVNEDPLESLDTNYEVNPEPVLVKKIRKRKQVNVKNKTCQKSTKSDKKLLNKRSEANRTKKRKVNPKSQENQFDTIIENTSNFSGDVDSLDIKEENIYDTETFVNESDSDLTHKKNNYGKSIVINNADTENVFDHIDLPSENTEKFYDDTEELFEFGKYVAEQLMCLDVEEARLAQREIREILDKHKKSRTKEEVKVGQHPNLALTQTVQPSHVKSSVSPTAKKSKVKKTNYNNTRQATQSSSDVKSSVPSVTQSVMVKPTYSMIPMLNINKRQMSNTDTRQFDNTEETLTSRSEISAMCRETVTSTQSIDNLETKMTIESSRDFYDVSSNVEKDEMLDIKLEDFSGDET